MIHIQTVTRSTKGITVDETDLKIGPRLTVNLLYGGGELLLLLFCLCIRCTPNQVILSSVDGVGEILGPWY